MVYEIIENRPTPCSFPTSPVFHPNEMLFASFDDEDTSIQIWEYNKDELLNIEPKSQYMKHETATDNSNLERHCPSYLNLKILSNYNSAIPWIEHEFPGMITYALEYNKSSEFSILIDDKSKILKVKAGKKLLTVYNPKKHPGHISHNKSLTYSPNKYICNKCSGDLFEVAVGYEYPDEDVENPNDPENGS
jgi:hypothetical protein